MKKTIILLSLSVLSLSVFAQKKEKQKPEPKETVAPLKDTVAKPATDTVLVATVMTQKEFDQVLATIRENLGIGNLETKAFIQFIISKSRMIPNKEGK